MGSVVEGQDAAFRLALRALIGSGADMATGQLFSPSEGTLQLVSHAGFLNGFVEHFASVTKVDGTTCAAAFRSGRISQVGDVANDGTYAGEDRDVMLSAGVMACMSAPVFDRTGVPRGVVSAHFRTTGLRPTDVLADVASALGALLPASPGDFPEPSADGRGAATPAEEAEGLRRAMASRAIIEQAKGIVMATMGCDGERAFQVLVAQSQHENRKVREVAAEIVRHVANGAKSN